jgi:hypothetical protein
VNISPSLYVFLTFLHNLAADAERQKGVLAAIVELELHQRIFETDWRILPSDGRSKKLGKQTFVQRE